MRTSAVLGVAAIAAVIALGYNPNQVELAHCTASSQASYQVYLQAITSPVDVVIIIGESKSKARIETSTTGGFAYTPGDKNNSFEVTRLKDGQSDFTLTVQDADRLCK